jgi:multidrug resistance efflux pump
MEIMEFQVCQQDSDARWIVRLDDTEYGAYLDKEQAVLDAVEAAHDALETGRDAQVWLHEQANAARIL